MNQAAKKPVVEKEPEEDAISASERKRKELEADCAKMRDVSVERKAAPPARFELAQHCRNVHRFILPEGDTLEDALETDYWVHILPRIAHLDKIEINPDDGSFYAELQVRSIAFGQVVTAVIGEVTRFDDVQAPNAHARASEFDIKFRGPHEKWGVFSANDEVLITQLDTEGVAQNWLNDHLKAQRA